VSFPRSSTSPSILGSAACCAPFGRSAAVFKYQVLLWNLKWTQQAKLISHTPNNCGLEFTCQDFQSPKLIQFRTPSHNAPILPLVCVKFGRFQNPRFSICFVTETTYTTDKSHVHPLQHILPAVTGPSTLSVVSYALEILV
jgi:hypothetical protein